MYRTLEEKIVGTPTGQCAPDEGVGLRTLLLPSIVFSSTTVSLPPSPSLVVMTTLVGNLQQTIGSDCDGFRRTYNWSQIRNPTPCPPVVYTFCSK